MNFQKKPRKEALELQLTAMIDIFTMIVIFLIKGTVMGAADLNVPNETKLPKSYSAESVESAPQVIITKTEVSVANLSKEKPHLGPIKLSEFKLGRAVTSKLVGVLKADLQAELAKLTPEARRGGVLLSVISDQSTSYADLFDVVRVFREAGFESLLFIALNEVKRSDHTKGAGQ